MREEHSLEMREEHSLEEGFVKKLVCLKGAPKAYGASCPKRLTLRSHNRGKLTFFKHYNVDKHTHIDPP